MWPCGRSTNNSNQLAHAVIRKISSSLTSALPRRLLVGPPAPLKIGPLGAAALAPMQQHAKRVEPVVPSRSPSAPPPHLGIGWHELSTTGLQS
jgi:hypothetical protein